MRYYQLKIISNKNKKGHLLQHLFLNFFSPGEKPATETATVQPAPMPVQQRVTACSCPQPSFVNRAGWNCPQGAWNPSNTSVTHLIVHHSAGGNTSSDWGAVVLSIWNFHTGTNGYSDIGYNWLIAPDGTVYEGRYKSSTDDVSGAHFCGFNGNTMGVCMMGTYTSQTVTAAAKNSLIRLLAWKACQRSIDPLATSFHAGSNTIINNVSGHRQGCATECPGNMLYADLPGIRTSVQSYSDNGCTLTAVPEIDGLEEFSVSPNPAIGVVYMKLKLNNVKKLQYNILGADGKLLYASPEQAATGVLLQEINAFRSLPAATYYIQLRINDQVITKQIIRH